MCDVNRLTSSVWRASEGRTATGSLEDTSCTIAQIQQPHKLFVHLRVTLTLTCQQVGRSALTLNNHVTAAVIDLLGSEHFEPPDNSRVKLWTETENKSSSTLKHETWMCKRQKHLFVLQATPPNTCDPGTAGDLTSFSYMTPSVANKWRLDEEVRGHLQPEQLSLI